MLVQKVLSELANPTRWKQAIGQGSAQETPATSAAASPSAGSSSALREILSQYDVRDISPRTFSEMLDRLHRAGAIDDADFRDLSLVRADLEREGVGPDERTDLLSFYQRQVQGASPGQTEAATAQRRLDWLAKASLLQTSDALPSVDRLA